MKKLATAHHRDNDQRLQRYRSLVENSGAYDELLTSTGEVREHWAGIIDQLSLRSTADLTTRALRLDARVRETGIAYDIFSQPDTPSQCWSLDLVPVVMAVDEWRSIERGVLQRATLLDHVLKDIYSQQSILGNGMLPAELVFSDPSYLHPCRTLPAGAHQLHVYAADIARGTDGTWRVIDNHTETLAGLGFSLANRVAYTHILGDLFKALNGKRLAGYFHDFLAGLNAGAKRPGGRIALLTPGPHHPDYFSHAYIARYLGLVLVEGGDLRTRDSAVFLKTLEGLKEIDRIVRCVDGQLIDALELNPAGMAGPAGLLNVVRGNPDLVINSIGSATVQNRALAPYLPELARHLLDEDLQLPDAGRLWLGDRDNRRHVAANLDRFMIREAQEATGRAGRASLGQSAKGMSAQQRQALIRRIELHGATLVAEDIASFSVAPVFADGELVPRPFAIRVYAARTEQGFTVMPGGLAMTVDPNIAITLNAPDGHTRDVWIASSAEPEQQPSSLWRPRFETAQVERSQRVIQSRVADDLFWLGRYGERADWTMRVLRGTYRRIEEDSGFATGLEGAARCLSELLLDDALERAKAPTDLSDDDILKLCATLVDSDKAPRSLSGTLSGLYRTAQLARDRLSYEALDSLSLFRPGSPWRTAMFSASASDRLDLLDDGLAALAAFNGLMHENMTRNHGWRFLDMGRRLERAFNLSEAIAALFVPAPDPEEETNSLFLLLELADSFITYRSRYRLDPMLGLVLDLLLIDQANPRSLAFQLNAISVHLDDLPNANTGAAVSEDRRLALNLLNSIRIADVLDLAKSERREQLDQLLQHTLEQLPELSDAVARHYFNLTAEKPHRLSPRPGALP